MRKRRMNIFGLLAILIALAIITILIILHQYNLQVATYTIKSPKIKDSFRIMLLTDLHNFQYGKDNEILIEKIRQQDADIILMVGDMNADDPKREQRVMDLIKEFSKDKPVYFSLGNHEEKIIDKTTYLEDVVKSGATLLMQEEEQIEIKGNSITIAGLREYPFYEFEYDNTASKEFFENFCKHENFKLLLCHWPEYYMWKFKDYNIDLMVAGHAHGGIVQLPFGRTLYAPSQGFFPKYVAGIHKSDTATMVVSRGVGGHSGPRLNNPPEITVIDVEKE